MKIIEFTCALLMMACISVSHATVIHDTDASGNLVGAKNVLVDGTLYDVAFLDGTCFTLFNGCDDNSDFTFTTAADAELASQALLDLVFIDQNGVNQEWDSNPSLTNGCPDPIVIFCLTITPYNAPGFNTDSLTSIAFNDINENNDRTRFDRCSSSLGNCSGSRLVWAVWTNATNVPEPRTVILLSLGIVALFVSRHRKNLNRFFH